MRPDLSPFDAAIERADRRIADAVNSIGPENAPPAMRQALTAELQGVAIRGIQERYLDQPTPVDFRVNVNPLVIWLWIGGAIAVAGGLIAIGPAPAARRRRVADVYAARLARDLGRA
jgi:cytochrome c-type biogenesis protein CcmF